MKKHNWPEGPRAPHHKFYNTADWRNTSTLAKEYNPICQRILTDGKQCTNPSTIVHHIFDPRDKPHLCLALSNLVALCACHHAASTRGEKHNEIYCRTIGPLGAAYDHGHDIWPSWHKNFDPDAPKRLLKPGKSTTIGDDLLDAALAEYGKKKKPN